MASTNKTVTLQLSQFTSTDKPSWLTDYNDDMEKIDTFAAGVDGDVRQAVSDAANAKTIAQTANTTAQQAQTAATQAQNAAQQAQTTAETSQSTANNALYVAQSAAKNYQYSTTERNTGNKWTDGKTIYEKVIKFNLPSTVNTINHQPVGTAIDTVVSISGGVVVTGTYCAINSPYGVGTANYIWVTAANNTATDENQLNNCITDSIMVNQPCTVILQYTKV